MFKQTKSNTLLLFLLLLTSFSCNKWTNRAKGSTIGATSGAVVGGVIGKKAGNTAAGVLIGAAVGGSTGFLIGKYMDKQAAEVQRDIAGSKVERIGEGILITFDSKAMFDINKFSLKSTTRNDLNDLSTILNKYDDTKILVRGHTDNSGSETYNQELSQNRATSVRNFLSQKGVTSSRMTLEGFGEYAPIADNSTASGRRQNRRVEIAIYANRKLKKMAKKGNLENTK